MNAILLTAALSLVSSGVGDPPGITQGGRTYHAGGYTPLPPSAGSGSLSPGSPIVPPSSVPYTGTRTATRSQGSLMTPSPRARIVIRPAAPRLIPSRIP